MKCRHCTALVITKEKSMCAICGNLPKTESCTRHRKTIVKLMDWNCVCFGYYLGDPPGPLGEPGVEGEKTTT